MEKDGKKARCEVTVQNSVKNIFISLAGGGEDMEIDISTNPIGQFDISYDPPDANVGTDLTLTSRDPEIATVDLLDSSGKVTGHNVGETIITVSSSARGGIEATATVTVVATPTGISLNKTNLTLDKSVNSTEKLNATISPDYANKDTNITWTSSNTNVATVNNEGLITAKANGDTLITARTGNEKTATCNVKVQTTPTSVSLNKTSATLDMSGTKTVQLTATVNPGDANTSNDLTWSSSNTSVATVNNSGLVTGINNGTATITVKTQNGKTAKCDITVQTNPTGVVLNKTSATIDLSTSTKTVQLSATVNPSSSNINKGLTWSSNNSSVATVNSSGLVTGVKNGTATITVRTQNGITATCNVVVNTTITSLTVSPTSATIDVGATKQLTCTKNPASTNEGIVWSSSNTNVATVNNNGLVTAKGSGRVTITVKNASATQSATCQITCLGKYTITYNANGGSGAPGNQTKTEGVNLTLSSARPTRVGYTFQGWGTSAGGSVVYAAGATYTGNANLNLFAVWKAVQLSYSGSYGRTSINQTTYRTLATSETIEFKPTKVTATASYSAYAAYHDRYCYAWIQGLDGSNWVDLADGNGKAHRPNWLGAQNIGTTVNLTAYPTKVYSQYRLVVRMYAENIFADVNTDGYIHGSFTISM